MVIDTPTISSRLKETNRTIDTDSVQPELTGAQQKFYSDGDRRPPGYFIRRLLGKGGAGVVWLAESFTDDLTVAAK